MTRLNIFIDETGEFGFNKNSAKLYGVSMVFHEQKHSISKEMQRLNQCLKLLDFNNMIHMGDLVAGHGDYTGMSIAERRKIYQKLYRFATTIRAKYHTILIYTHYYRNNKLLSKAITVELNKMINSNLNYFLSFDHIKVYYDGGQKPLNRIITDTFLTFDNTIQQSDFNHVEKKLFQVADMLTYVDKIIYKYNKRIRLTQTEKTFFSTKQIRMAINQLRPHRLE